VPSSTEKAYLHLVILKAQLHKAYLHLVKVTVEQLGNGYHIPVSFSFHEDKK
jgi:hypothetical protein